jgi:hypothetical protein
MDVGSAEKARSDFPPWTYALQNFAIALLLRAFHALNQNISTDNLFDPDLIRGSLEKEKPKQALKRINQPGYTRLIKGLIL